MAEAKLPTRDEIAQLPRWAIVAFAARCARRVQPLFAYFWHGSPHHHVVAVEHAIRISEQYAHIGCVNPIVNSHLYALAAAKAANSAAADADAALDEDYNRTGISYHAAGAAANAASSAAAESHPISIIADYAADAYEDATAALHAYYKSYVGIDNYEYYYNSVIELLKIDFARLLDVSRQEKWDDTTPVPPSFFEPLEVVAPTLTPNDPLESDEHVAMVLQAFSEPGVRAGTLAEHLLAVYKALNQYTLAKYGRHLSRGRFRRLVLLHSGVPA